ncbi:hypothetical protein GYMLUDRAFT_245700 [Collybiopsis luxurians FD-317 M1]|uniref:Meiotically up-regulated protein Msb1/Mug8 domain-containing protein n=1 Tax=Collybiopsis luxurians FD-317 M1 TaxID=944289 RepID=A0A0D0B6A1_9AGAR|nr:hypothetical protein GYMLUDRAFT_245700 [Collybiopsis luxurians FD-317 M1]
MPSIFSRSKSNNNSSLPQLPLSAILPTDASGQFVDTLIPPTPPSSSASSSGNSAAGTGGSYGFLSPYPNLILGLYDLQHLVSLVSTHLDVETPFVFNSDALDLDAGRVRRLIDKYVQSLSTRKGTTHLGGSTGAGGGGTINFDEEARFAGPHELGMLLRWALARVVRIDTHPTTKQESLTRTLIPYLAYLNWAKQEHLHSYPPTHFSTLLETRSTYVEYESVTTTTETGELRRERREVSRYREVLPEPLKGTLVDLFGVLARLIAHSAKSGITPPSLSPLFGPLLFGLGPLERSPSSPSPSSTNPSAGSGTPYVDPSSFESAYAAYLRSVHATEHLILSFIRWQDTPGGASSSGRNAVGGTVGGVPTRLKEWIRDYPRMLSGHANILALSDSLSTFSGMGMGTIGGGGRIPIRKGAKTSRVVEVKRTVEHYERDLVRFCARWALPYLSGGGSNYASPTGGSGSSLGGSREWGRIAPALAEKDKDKGAGSTLTSDGKMPPRYSDAYRKKMNIPPGMEPGSSPFAPASLSSSTSSSLSYSSSYSSTLSPLTRSTSAMSSYSYTNPNDPSSASPSSSSPGTPSTPTSQHGPTTTRFKTLTDAQWGLFETSGFSSSSSPSSSLTSIENALKFDLTESARKARTQRNRGGGSGGLSGSGGWGGGGRNNRDSMDWGAFVNGGFDRANDRDRLSIATGGMVRSAGTTYGGSFARPRGGGGGGGGGGSDDAGVRGEYVGADGKLADVTEFTLDTGLNAALQFNFGELGLLGLVIKDKEREKEKEKEREREREREKERGLGKRLKRKEKPLPPFTWSTTPVLASETIIESAFLDVWVDLVSWGFASGTVDVDVLESRMGIYGAELDPNTNVSGMALSRTISRDDGDFQDPAEAARWKSELFKECNWVLVEFKALPNSTSPAISSHVASNDPRTSTSLLLFEEFVPREYRAQLGHQLAGIHPSLILNPSLGSAYSSSTSTSPPSSSSTGGRVRLGSLFSSPGHAGAASTASLVDTGRGKKEKKIKEAKSKKDKKDKAGVGGGGAGGGGGTIFSGSTRTLTMASTPTPYDPRNGQSGTPTPTPYSKQTYADGTTSSSTVGPMISRRPPRGDSLNQSKEMDFEGMLRDENRGTKVITLNGSLHTMDAHGGGMSDVEAGMSDNENEEDGKYSVHSRTTATHDGLPEGAMPPRTPGSNEPPPQPTSSTGHEHANHETTAAPVPSPTTPSTKRGANIFRLPASSSSPSTSKQHQPSAKPKGPKAPTNRGRRHSKQNLVPAEYHTVEFEARLTSGGETEEESDPFKADGAAGGGDVLSQGDGFVEEAARRRRAARLAERERLKSERRGGAKRFSLGLGGGGSKGGDDADDDTWVDIVVPSMGGASSGNGEGRKPRDPDEASQEVARVLNAVRGGQPYGLDDESDFEDGRHAPPTKEVRGSEYSDDIEVQTVPRKGLVHPEDEYHDLRPENGNGYLDYEEDKSDLDEEEEPEDKPVVPKQRLGYFDLHPERRPASLEILKQPRDTAVATIGSIESEDHYGDDDEDPRARYAYGSDDEHEHEEGTAERPRDLDKLYAAKVQPPKERERDKSSRPLPTLPPNGPSASVPTSSSPTPTPPAPVPTPPSKPNILTATTSGTPGKTAALIEMYREREKKSTTSPTLNSPQPKVPAVSPSSSPAPSRIPVKAGLPSIPSPAPSASAPSSKLNAPSPPLSLPTSPAAPVPVAKPASKASAVPSTVGINSEFDDEDDGAREANLEELIPPTKIGVDDSGRGSPGRYVHGAPLHNVLEEEEEE